MKRILPILMAVLLVVAMAVPAFADEVYTVSGVWVGNDTVSFTNFTESVNFGFPVYAQYNSCTGLRFVSGASDYQLQFENGGSYSYIYSIDKSTGVGEWLSDNYRTIDLGETEQEVSGVFYTWFIANFKPAQCDGSTCPATDVNLDNVCDDCGLPLTYNLRGYPSIEGIWNKSVYPYGLVFIRGDGIPSLYFFDNPYTTDDGVNLRFNDGNFEVYNLVDGAWVFERTGVGAVDFPDLDSGRIVKLSHDVVFDGSVIQSSDSDFFPTPLWEKMELVTQGEMTGLRGTLGGTMTTLVLCGVGCLALLVVLSLFGKRSLLFLS